MWRSLWILVGCVVGASAELAEQAHPRLWLAKAGEQGVRERLVRDPLAGRLHEGILAEAERVLSEPTCRYEIPDGRRLLAQSRLALHHISHCAWAWRFTGGKRYLDRAVREMEAACALKDWNPDHFLDTAEMSLAVAWGMDWLHEALEERQRVVFWNALAEKGLRPAAERYRQGVWWSQPKSNWAQVCGAGIALAAMATAERDPGLCEGLVENGIRLIEKCHRFYHPDGMYPEGPGYWHYGTHYHVMLLAACRGAGVACDEDPVMGRAGAAMLHMTGSTGVSFNFADAKEREEWPSVGQCWIATRYRDKAQAMHVRRLFGTMKGGKTASPLALLWLPDDPGQVELPREAVFHGEQPVAIFRTSWDKEAAWFAMKGGTARTSHGHMDAGSFVYEVSGVRWFHDLGSDQYQLPGYFGKKRWDYYRVQSRSHNTLEIAGQLQNEDAEPCPIIASGDVEGRVRVTFDLTNAYAGAASRVLREARFDRVTGEVGLADDIEGASGGIVWRAFTHAAAEVRGHDVLLSRAGESLWVRNKSGTGVWTVESARPPTDAEQSNRGFVALTLRVPPSDRVGLRVDIVPVRKN